MERKEQTALVNQKTEAARSALDDLTEGPTMALRVAVLLLIEAFEIAMEPSFEIRMED